MSISKDQVTQQLSAVRDGHTGKTIVDLGMVENVAVCEGYVTVRLAGAGLDEEIRKHLSDNVKAAVRDLGDEIKQVNVEITETEPQETPTQSGSQAQGSSQTQRPEQEQGQASPQESARQSNPLPAVQHVIAIGAGKGGVGKSTVAVNLAVGLARQGQRVGLLDGDIYGPSTPTLLGLHEHQVTGTSQQLHPFYVHGIKTITIGKLVDPEKPLIWRGPMAHGAFRQLATQTEWGELDVLIVDLPPGTGDVPLTLAQLLPLTGAVIVCTPQRVAQDDAVRAVRMFQQLEIPVLGVVENMSYFIGDDGKEYDIFGRGGANEMADRLQLNMLGTVPINMALRANGDAGEPLKNFDAGDALAEELETMCRNVQHAIETEAASRPTLSVK